MSKLPRDIKKRKEAAEEVTRTLNRDLQEKGTPEWVAPYLDKHFHQAAVEWTAATDQVGNLILKLIFPLISVVHSPSKSSNIPSSRN